MEKMHNLYLKVETSAQCAVILFLQIIWQVNQSILYAKIYLSIYFATRLRGFKIFASSKRCAPTWQNRQTHPIQFEIWTTKGWSSEQDSRERGLKGGESHFAFAFYDAKRSARAHESVFFTWSSVLRSRSIHPSIHPYIPTCERTVGATQSSHPAAQKKCITPHKRIPPPARRKTQDI
jgi:hypothetical protein